jgi:hypothetical protein
MSSFILFPFLSIEFDNCRLQVFDAEVHVCIGSNASSTAQKTRAVLIVQVLSPQLVLCRLQILPSLQGHNLHLDAILCLCQVQHPAPSNSPPASPRTPNHDMHSAIGTRSQSLYALKPMRQSCLVCTPNSSPRTGAHVPVELLPFFWVLTRMSSFAALQFRPTKATEPMAQQCTLFCAFCVVMSLFLSFRYCLSINRSDSVNVSTQQLTESVDTFSRQDVCICFEDMKSFEAFVDAVKRCCASASQALNYIDSLPLAPKRDKGALGSKGCVFYSSFM